MDFYNRERVNYHNLNSVAKKNGVVLIGSTFAKEIPVCELRQTFHMDCDIYNRSYTDLSVYDAKELITECIHELQPQRILLNLGETDLERGFHSIQDIISQYEVLISDLRKTYPGCQFVIVSLCGSEYVKEPAVFNHQLETLAHKLKCQFADISTAKSSPSPSIKAFDILRFFMLDQFTLSDVLLANA